MLKLFRQKKLGVKLLLFAIVFMVGAGMLLYLVPGLGSGSLALTDSQGVLAQVGNSVVTQVEVNRLVQQQVRQLGGDNDIFRRFLLESTVEGLINRRLVEYEAEQLGLQVSSAELAKRLQEISIFYPDGNFVGADSYTRLVQQQYNRSVPEFEQGVRRQLLVNKLITWVRGGVTVSPTEVEQEYRRRNERVRIQYVLFLPGTYEKQLEPSEDDLRAFYERNRDRYLLPERRSVRYVPVDFFTLQQRVQVTPEELEAFYQSRRQDFQVSERVRFRHILFLVVQPDERAAVREKAEGVLARLRRDADFAALAREHSEHEDSKEQGGEMDWIQRGQTVPALENKLFALPADSAPELVETSYGFHLVQVLAHQAERSLPLEEVRGQIEPFLRQRTVQDQALAQAQQIVEAVRAGQSLQQAAQADEWPVLESPLFSRQQVLPEFGGNFDFQGAAFRLPTETAGQPDAPVSEPVGLPTGFVVMQLKEVSRTHTAEFDDVRAQVESGFRQERGVELAREAAQQLAGEAGGSGNLASAARRSGLEVKTSPLVNRETTLPDLGPVSRIAATAFNLPVGQVSEAQQVAGKWVAFRVLERTEADLGRLEEERDTLRAQLLEKKRSLHWEIFQQSLRKRRQADGVLKLNQAAINRILGRR